jgi:hypothetical protein
LIQNCLCFFSIDFPRRHLFGVFCLFFIPERLKPICALGEKIIIYCRNEHLFYFSFIFIAPCFNYKFALCDVQTISLEISIHSLISVMFDVRKSNHRVTQANCCQVALAFFIASEICRFACAFA